MRDADANDRPTTPPDGPATARGLAPVDEQPDTPQWLLDLVKEEGEEQVNKSLSGPRRVKFVLCLRRR